MVGLRTIFGLASAMLIAVSAPALAQSCKETFVKAATEGNGEGQYRQIVTQRIQGGSGETVNEFIMNGRDHWVTKSIKPEAGGWTLLHNGVMYSSNDKGKSWREVTKFDKKAAEAARAQQKQDVETAADIACETDEIDGKKLNRVHGRYETTTGFKSTQIHTYWMDPETSLIVRSEYETVSSSFKSTVSQRMIPFGDATVPVP